MAEGLRTGLNDNSLAALDILILCPTDHKPIPATVEVRAVKLYFDGGCKQKRDQMPTWSSEQLEHA